MTGRLKPAPTFASRRRTTTGAEAFGVRQLAAALSSRELAPVKCRKDRRARQAAMRQGGGKPPHSEERRADQASKAWHDGPAEAGPYVRFAKENDDRGGGFRSAAACCRP